MDGTQDGILETPPTTASAKLQLSKQHERRLIEYFVIISSIPCKKEKKSMKKSLNISKVMDDYDGLNLSTKEETNQARLKEYLDDVDFLSRVTGRYPLEDHPENPLHDSISSFCHPMGSIKPSFESSMPKIHFFVSTGGRGQQVYGTCLTMYEAYDVSSLVTDVDVKICSEVYLPKFICILSSYPYLVAFREFLSQLFRLTKSGDMPLPVERYIVNFCSEIPAPPPGAFEVQTTILDSEIKLWCPPHNQPIPWVSLPFSHLFQCLDVEKIVFIWHALTLERKILLTSTQLSLLTTCSEILLSLLYPLTWSHAYIPVVPHFLVPILSAPMPFLCGIDKYNLPSALNDLSLECIVVDLDKNQVTLGPKTPSLPPLPKDVKNNLLKKLEMNVGMVFREVRCLSKNDDHSHRGINLKPHIKEMADAAWDGQLCLFDEAFHLNFTPEESRKNMLNGNDNLNFKKKLNTAKEKRMLELFQTQWDVVQEAFLTAYAHLLRNYRKYLVFPSKANEGSYGGAGFRSKQFVQSQKYNDKLFMRQFVNTQMFDYFITKRLYGSGEPDVIFFDQAIDRTIRSYTSDSLPSGGPLCQSSKVHRKLKTIVPPEPSALDLPIPSITSDQGTLIGSATVSFAASATDDISVVSIGSTSTGVNSGVHSMYSHNTDSVQKEEEGHGMRNYYYTYKTFPETLDKDLLGSPRPLSNAVLAEFDRQEKNAGRFRTRVMSSDDQIKEKKSSAEVSTFTVFFMVFTSVVGKGLLDVGNEPKKDVPILSSCIPQPEKNEEIPFPSPNSKSNHSSDINTTDKIPKKNTLKFDNKNDDSEDDQSDDDDFQSCEGNEDCIDISFKSSKDDTISLTSSVRNGGSKESMPPLVDTVEPSTTPDSPTTPITRNRNRFLDSQWALKVQEAKATATAKLDLVFEMLEMMRLRGLKADPNAYQCLIDACGRCGDTKRATQLLKRMHEDGIVADGAVYSCLVNAFSSENAWKKLFGSNNEENLPEWANGNAVEMDWNQLNKGRSYIDYTLTKFALAKRSVESNTIENGEKRMPLKQRLNNLKLIVQRKNSTTDTTKLDDPTQKILSELTPSPEIEERKEIFVTEPIQLQIQLGENLLELLYPNISIDADIDTCPRCRSQLSDDEIVSGWKACDSQDYTTTCPYCKFKFVSHFSVQSTSPTFMGSRGASSPLFCERLSPWVLQKELHTILLSQGIDDLLSPEWRTKETKNAVVWWNLVLSFMRYRLPFSFLMQGSFQTDLVQPTPDDP